MPRSLLLCLSMLCILACNTEYQQYGYRLLCEDTGALVPFWMSVSERVYMNPHRDTLAPHCAAPALQREVCASWERTRDKKSLTCTAYAWRTVRSIDSTRMGEN